MPSTSAAMSRRTRRPATLRRCGLGEVPKDGEEFGKLPGHENSVRHGIALVF